PPPRPAPGGSRACAGVVVLTAGRRAPSCPPPSAQRALWQTVEDPAASSAAGGPGGGFSLPRRDRRRLGDRRVRGAAGHLRIPPGFPGRCAVVDRICPGCVRGTR